MGKGCRGEMLLDCSKGVQDILGQGRWGKIGRKVRSSVLATHSNRVEVVQSNLPAD